MMVEMRAMSSYRAHSTEVETEAQGVSAGARGLTQFRGTPRGSKALSVEPSRTAIALIQWFPNARDREPFLAEPLWALEEHWEPSPPAWA